MIPAAELISRIAESCALDPASLSQDTMIEEIGLDSLSLAQILTSLEAEFSIDLNEEELARILEAHSIGDYLRVLNSALSR
jgi:acyl carrier protein